MLSNKAPDGGYGVFNELHGDNNLALWLQAAGYRTGYIGKFLNEYAEPDEYGTLPIDVPEAGTTGVCCARCARSTSATP